MSIIDLNLHFQDGLTLTPKYNHNKNNQNQFISGVTKLILEVNPYFTINEILKIITDKHNIPYSYGFAEVYINKRP